MAMQHIDDREADLFMAYYAQDLDSGLELETINKVWPGLIMI